MSSGSSKTLEECPRFRNVLVKLLDYTYRKTIKNKTIFPKNTGYEALLGFNVTPFSIRLTFISHSGVTLGYVL